MKFITALIVVAFASSAFASKASSFNCNSQAEVGIRSFTSAPSSIEKSSAGHVSSKGNIERTGKNGK